MNVHLTQTKTLYLLVDIPKGRLYNPISLLQSSSALLIRAPFQVRRVENSFWSFLTKEGFVWLPWRWFFSGILHNFTLHFLHCMHISFQHKNVVSSESWRCYRSIMCFELLATISWSYFTYKRWPWWFASPHRSSMLLKCSYSSLW